MYGVDASIIMNPRVWKASGHVDGFADPLVECKACKRRYRADQLENPDACPECDGSFGEVRQFNMMFKTAVGAIEGEDAVAYLRPETAQGMFANFKNVVDSQHPKLPFGLAQIGKAFRNEIAPRDFIFRAREFEQMEIEYFVREEDWEGRFADWLSQMYAWLDLVGIPRESVHELEVPQNDLAHYSKRTIDFEFDFPFGRKELYGLAYRTDFDLKNHAAASGEGLYVVNDETGEKVVPHCIEPTFGVDRTVLAVLASAYEEVGEGDEKRTVLKLKPALAPYKACVSPLLKNKPELVEKARIVYSGLKNAIGSVAWDDNGNIGKRYRRQDEIGTPYCVVIDFDTLTDESVTVRDRDTATQDRVLIAELEQYLSERLK
jgi:glycyl-tRNA synthetase